MTVLGIIGMNRSGSTVVSMVLDGLPGVTSLGEAHHFVSYPHWAGCTSCGPDNCPVLTPEVRQEAAIVVSRNSANLYGFLREVTGSRVLVVSDKLPKIYEEQTCPPDKGLLVLKSPLATIVSNVDVLRKIRETPLHLQDRELNNEEIEYALKMFDGYRGIMNWCDSNCPDWKFLSLDTLVERPKQSLEALAELCGTTPDPQALRFWENPHHQIAGNTNVRTGRGPLAGGLNKDVRWRDVVTSAQVRAIRGDPRVAAVHKRAAARRLI